MHGFIKHGYLFEDVCDPMLGRAQHARNCQLFGIRQCDLAALGDPVHPEYDDADGLDPEDPRIGPGFRQLKPC